MKFKNFFFLFIAIRNAMSGFNHGVLNGHFKVNIFYILKRDVQDNCYTKKKKKIYKNIDRVPESNLKRLTRMFLYLCVLEADLFWQLIKGTSCPHTVSRPLHTPVWRSTFAGRFLVMPGWSLLSRR